MEPVIAKEPVEIKLLLCLIYYTTTNCFSLKTMSFQRVIYFGSNRVVYTSPKYLLSFVSSEVKTLFGENTRKNNEYRGIGKQFWKNSPSSYFRKGHADTIILQMDSVAQCVSLVVTAKENQTDYAPSTFSRRAGESRMREYETGNRIDARNEIRGHTGNTHHAQTIVKVTETGSQNRCHQILFIGIPPELQTFEKLGDRLLQT